jgi:hypothetical protein
MEQEKIATQQTPEQVIDGNAFVVFDRTAHEMYNRSKRDNGVSMRVQAYTERVQNEQFLQRALMETFS